MLTFPEKLEPGQGSQLQTGRELPLPAYQGTWLGPGASGCVTDHLLSHQVNGSLSRSPCGCH